MAAPGTIGNLVAPGEDAMNRKVEDLTRSLKELAPSVMETILPLITDLQAQQAELEAQNVVLTAAVAEIAALVDTQIVFLDAFAGDSGIGYSTSFTAQAVCTLAIPAGYTKFTFSGASVARLYNTTGGTVYLYSQTYSKVVGSTDAWGATCQDTIANGFQSTVTAPHSVTHTIPGGATQVQIWASVRCTSAAAADALNFAGVEGVAFFSR